MARRIRLDNVTEADLAEAEAIAAVDAGVPDYYKQVWTLTTTTDPTRADEAMTATPALNELEVELNSADPDQYPRLKEMVETAKASFLEGMWDLDT